ncbi:MAG TPA: DUF4870 domain-containing protein, partial [Blastocatellia bacterium]|nr:DUF4870 domain-containing protein [Blastocatellia bacterium]
MSNQPPNYPPSGGYQGGGGYPGGGAPPPQGGKTKVLGLEYNIAGLLCYLPVCCINLISSILFLVTEPKENKLLRFHAIQSLGLTAVAVILGIAYYVVVIVLTVGGNAAGGAAAAGAGIGSLLVTLVFGVLWLGWLIACIVGCVKAYQLQIWKLPIIGNIA